MEGNRFRQHMKAKLCGKEGENLFNEEFIPSYSSKEIIDKFYEAYLENLRKSPMDLRWVRLRDIEKRPARSWHVIGDKFLENSKEDNMSLARDIIENGTYWPVYLGEKVDGIHPVKDGLHRVNVLQTAQEEGLMGQDEKILAVIRGSKAKKKRKELYKIPSPLSISYVLLGLYIRYYKKAARSKPIPYTDNTKLFVYHEDDYGEIPTMMYSLLLRNAIFEYNQNNDEKFKGAKVINDEEAYNLWRQIDEDSI